jgi:hypothetical protein
MAWNPMLMFPMRLNPFSVFVAVAYDPELSVASRVWAGSLREAL